MKNKKSKGMKISSTSGKKKKFKFNKQLRKFLDKAGIDESPRDFNKKIIKIDIIIIAILSFFIIVAGIILKTSIGRILSVLLVTLTLLAIAIYMLSILAMFTFLDLKIYRRTQQVEEVLPDFLQLTSANISAGMTIDRALWLAVRPRFGVLAREMEQIAKATIAGEDLNTALLSFAEKYDSRMLKEGINLLIAGLDAGGEIAELLNKIAINIQETKLMQKEIAANVMTYVIFISVATIAAAPFLFALSGQLLSTTQSITSNLDIDSSSGVSSSFSFDFSEGGISLSNFNNFAILMMIISSIFSVSIISTIRKGSIKGSLKLIPVYLGVSLVVYYAAKVLFQAALGGLI